MKKGQWIFMPHPAHFICSRWCKFFLSTYVNGYIVSTIGEYWPERSSREIHAEVYDPEWLVKNKGLKGDKFDAEYFKRFGYEDIGCDRKYETMVFKAKESDHKCCPYQQADGDNIDFNGYDEAEEAFAGHYEMCNKYDKI